jgi:D,D-heptose 1,7-bisphosphate phosphatase
VSLRTGLFLDRDGTIIVERGYLSDPRGVELLPGVAQVIREAKALSLPVVVITNQSGVARGLFTEQDVQAVNERLKELIKDAGATIDAIYYCPHLPGAGNSPYSKVCSCRKPSTGMLEMAQKAFGIDLASSFVIGDKCSDVRTGINAGSKTVLVLTGMGRTEAARCTGIDAPDFVAEDLPAAWKYVTGELRKRKNVP